MPPPFQKINVAQFAALLKQFPFTRKINAVHMHHTWRPNRAQYQGHATIVGMWRFHTSPPNNWRDIAQHLTIGPDGSLWLGRNWNLAPASAGGHNGTGAAGPFMFEMIGDFDRGKDPFEGAQREATLNVIALVQDRFNLPTGSLRFHNQMSPKSCPGTAISYSQVLQAVQQLRADGREGLALEGMLLSETGQEGRESGAGEGEELILLGDDAEPPLPPEGEVFLLGEEEAEEETDAAAGAAPAGGSETGNAEVEPEAEAGVQELILGIMRGELGTGGAARAESPYAELEEGDQRPDGEEDGDRLRRSRVAVAGEEGLFGGPTITAEMKEALRLHVVNLSRGRFSTGGVFRTDANKVDALFEALEEAVAGKSAAAPLRLVLWAHGGLVNEETGLRTAYKHVLWWQRNGVYPLYFVWETGLLEVLGRLLTGRSGGEEVPFKDAFLDVTDRFVEALARRVKGAAIWSDMKQSAHLAINPDEGGAYQVAQRLAAFCRRHGDAVELHAVGHSAGAIFHASFLPTAFQAGVPRCKSLHLLAPAVRVDRFHERLAPHIGPGRPIERVVLFTMHNDLERADNCIGLYHKSLLYLVSASLEEDANEPILGMEKYVRADPALTALFGLGSSAGTDGAPGEAVWAKTRPGARPGSRSTCSTHGGFDDDPATLDSILVRILGRDQIPLSYAKAGRLSPDEAAQGMADGTAAGGHEAGFVPGEESVTPEAEADEEEFFVVSFDVLDAFERAAELAPDTPELAENGDEAEGLEAPSQPSIAFGPNANSAHVTAFSRQVLLDIMRQAGLTRVVISSTSRDPKNQARVMFNNLPQFGVAHQKALYGAGGDQVIEVYRQARAAGKSATAIQALMEQKIVQIGPAKVSRHASDPRVLNVFDVAPGSVTKKKAFEQAVRADSRVAKFITPPTDPGYHLEIPQRQS